MKFTIKGPFKDNFYNLMRNIGYSFLEKNDATGEMSFVNPIGNAGRYGYPRFHLFLTIKNDDFIFDFHLDQKRPSYQGSAAHSGEYSGEVVSREAERIKEILKQ